MALQVIIYAKVSPRLQKSNDVEVQVTLTRKECKNRQRIAVTLKKAVSTNIEGHEECSSKNARLKLKIKEVKVIRKSPLYKLKV